MEKTKKTAAQHVSRRAAAGNLPAPEVVDATSTKGGKVSESTADKISASESQESEKKASLYFRASALFMPKGYDDTAANAALRAAVDAGAITESAAAAAVANMRRAWEKEHADEIAAAEGLSFAAVVARLKTAVMWQNICAFAGVGDIHENDIIKGDKVIIYHGESDKDGEKYTLQTLRDGEDSALVWFELVPPSTSAILRGLRNYNYFTAAARRLLKAVAKRNLPLLNFAKAYAAALEAGFSREQIMATIKTAE